MHPFVGSQPFSASLAAFRAVGSSFALICPSVTDVKAPGW